MMKERTGAVVIGAGVIGLACARALAIRGFETVIIEKNNGIGQETSSRNSEVIHAGLYYPTHSLKALLCTQGNRELYDYCIEHNIPHRRCGKLIVATHPTHEEKLYKLLRQANDNGIDDVVQLSSAQALTMEPALHCSAALHSPSTGIIDSHALMLALLGEAQMHGAVLALNSTVKGGRIGNDGIELLIRSSAEEMQLTSNIVINAAGLFASSVIENFDGFPQEHVPKTYYAKGNYYALAIRAPFARLIYPIPEAGGLGVHLTLDLSGQARFGPDVEWVESLEYSVDPSRSENFYAEIRKYWPQLPEASLTPAYCGIRPKLVGPGSANADFLIQGPENHGISGLVNLFGIESPGLTSCLSIAEHVCNQIGLSCAVRN
ncbi:MAG TPA: NAD(P)/FAD-dependent oxidoreductase [Rhodocyclaceae bacterium]|nr:NAD(P)/FAD-dependent oxidoreductase [Rhodocyclaceae bacterium]